MDKSEVKVKDRMFWEVLTNKLHDQEERIIALERALEAVLRRMEASGQADDEPGWYGRPE